MGTFLRVITLLVFFANGLAAQEGFAFDAASRKKVVIPFKFINNLVFVDVDVNGTKLTFLLDTGVDSTILFSLEENQQVGLSDVKKVRLIGLGGAETVEGLVSTGNTVSIKSLKDENHALFIVLDQDFNFSANVGIPVNGILGYQFFANYPVEIDYERRKIIVYKSLPEKRFKKFRVEPITIEENKPYVVSDVISDSGSYRAKLLVDSGNSDGVWLFPGKSDSIQIPEPNFEDFLGRGLSGDVTGRRGRVSQLEFAGHRFRQVLSSFPERGSIENVKMVEGRLGSLGAEILKRFRVVFDYPNKRMLLRANWFVDDPFHYNMSGLEIHHEGTSWVRQETSGVTSSQTGSEVRATQSVFLPFTFELKPVFMVANVRKGSPADEAGLKKGDIILSVNGKQAYRYTLQEINNLLKSYEGKQVKLTVDRKNVRKTFTFRLRKII